MPRLTSSASVVHNMRSTLRLIAQGAVLCCSRHVLDTVEASVCKSMPACWIIRDKPLQAPLLHADITTIISAPPMVLQ